MATITSIASGAWSADAATVWDSGTEPADGDIVIIAAAHTVSLDADHSAYVTGVDLEINGALIIPNGTPPTLLLSADITGAGALIQTVSPEAGVPAAPLGIDLNGNSITGVTLSATPHANAGSDQWQAVTTYKGKAGAWEIVTGDASNPAYKDFVYLLPPGDALTLTVWGRIDGAMSPLPKVEIFTLANDPLNGGTADASATLPAATINVWQRFAPLTVVNANTQQAQKYIVRFSAQDASDSFFIDYDIQHSPADPSQNIRLYG